MSLKLHQIKIFYVGKNKLSDHKKILFMSPDGKSFPIESFCSSGLVKEDGTLEPGEFEVKFTSDYFGSTSLFGEWKKQKQH
jgi:hypothetical protein